MRGARMSARVKKNPVLDHNAISSIVKLYHASFTVVEKKSFVDWLNSYTLIHGRFDTQKEVDIAEINSLYGLDINKETLFNLLFAIETYYAALMRIVAAKVVSGGDPSLPDVDEIMSGAYFEKRNIFNYNCDSIYDWYFCENSLKQDVLQIIVNNVKTIDTDTVPEDFLKDVYEQIFPSKVRRGMGEFHTPKWLVDFIIEDIMKSDPDFLKKKIIDPTCGSGSFLISILKRNSGEPESLSRLFGIDLNPISVLTTKTNLLLALNQNSKPVVLQIYQGDVIPSPIKSGKRDITTFGESKLLEVGSKTITFDDSWNYDEIIEEYLSIKCKTTTSTNIFDTDSSDIDQTYSALAQATIKDFDYVIGNPPWINWEYLPEEYKMKNVNEWNKYKLFALKGMNKNFIKEDISELVTYAAIDRFLKNSGILVFVLKESLLKSSKQAQEFRKFYIDKTKTPISVEKVYDLTQFKPFDAANKTIIMFIKKDKKTTYPVPYIVWNPIGKKRQNPDVSKDVFFEFMIAKPAVISDIKSGWITTTAETAEQKDTCLGTNSYKARTGVFTGGANSVFWLKILKDKHDSVLVENITERAIKKVEHIQAELENTYIHPMVRGRDLKLWEFKCEQSILLPHTAESKMYPVDIETIKRDSPLTYDYLHRFEYFLKNRQSFASWEQALLEKNYHTLQRVGPYTFCRYKVAWRYISSSFVSCVIDDDINNFNNTYIPNEKIIYIGLDNKDEAYYLCGVLSSEIYRKTIESFMVSTQIGPHILDKLNIPKFDPTNQTHIEISTACYKGHIEHNATHYLDIVNSLVNELHR